MRDVDDVSGALMGSRGKVDIVAVTQGKIVVSELSRPVNAAVTAEVAAVMVREGCTWPRASR
ncbi:hypothetical protein DMB90_11955 [Raoultella planticola]|uniref:Uncharacterized protein n=1 Tax=Raoultella planticola TaxID=575 RepID=A0A5P6AAQ4_RAOPL|nr:hypothetical protein DMB90_11955 [Raoultella planticola]